MCGAEVVDHMLLLVKLKLKTLVCLVHLIQFICGLFKHPLMHLHGFFRLPFCQVEISIQIINLVCVGLVFLVSSNFLIDRKVSPSSARLIIIAVVGG